LAATRLGYTSFNHGGSSLPRPDDRSSPRASSRMRRRTRISQRLSPSSPFVR